MYFDLYDVIYVFFLGVLGICLRFVECGLWYVNKKVWLSFWLFFIFGKNWGFVLFVVGMKFYFI